MKGVAAAGGQARTASGHAGHTPPAAAASGHAGHAAAAGESRAASGHAGHAPAADAAADAGTQKLLNLASELVRDPAVQREIQQDPELRQAWSDPAVRRVITRQP